MISSASSSGSPYSVEPPSRFMRADDDSIASTTRALTFSRARASSSSVAGCSRRRLELRADDLHRLGEVVGPRADVEADLAGVGELAGERVDRVGEPALLAHALEQPRGREPAEDRVEHAHGVAALVVARQARAAEADVDLLGLLGLEAHARLRQRRRGVGHRRGLARAQPAERALGQRDDRVVVDRAAAATTTEAGT